MCPDMITLMHMLTMIAAAHETLKTRIITAPSGRCFLPGDAVHDFLNSVQDALDLHVEISLETINEYANLPRPNIKDLN